MNFTTESKLLTREALARKLAFWRFQNLRIAFTNGCFDILHEGHIRYLEAARGLCDVLIIGLNSDSSVKRLKGSSRPINPQTSRARLLAALACVDAIVLFDEDTPRELISAIKPSYLIKGADYTVEQIAGAELMPLWHGQTLLIPLTEGFSTSKTVAKIQTDEQSR